MIWISGNATTYMFDKYIFKIPALIVELSNDILKSS